MLLDKIKEAIEEELDIDSGEITADTTFKELGADSLDLMGLVLKLEDEFGIEVPAEKLESLKSIGDVINYLNSVGIGD